MTCSKCGEAIQLTYDGAYWIHSDTTNRGQTVHVARPAIRDLGYDAIHNGDHMAFRNGTDARAAAKRYNAQVVRLTGAGRVFWALERDGRYLRDGWTWA